MHQEINEGQKGWAKITALEGRSWRLTLCSSDKEMPGPKA